MNVRLLALVTGLSAVVLVCTTVLLLAHVDPTPFIVVIGVVVTPILGVALYGKVEQIVQQTNGASAAKDALLSSVVEHLKTHNTVPIPEAQSPNTTTTVTTTNVTEPQA